MSKDTTRVIEADEEIYSPADRDEKGRFLTLEEQRGVIQLNLLEPLELSDKEPVNHLLVKAPRMRELQKFQSNTGTDAKREIDFFGGCCVGIKPQDVENLHAADWNRLSRLVANFIA